MKIKYFALVIVLLAILFPLKTAIKADGDIEPSDDDAFGVYYDQLKSNSQITLQNFYPINQVLTYEQTENLSSVAYADRNTAYGTYDVYTNYEGSEFQYLINSNLLCGFLKADIGFETPQADAITEVQAISCMEDFAENTLGISSSDFQNFTLSSIEYREQDGIYVAEYNRYVSGYKTDDVLCIWVDFDGEIVSFSELNRDRYSSLTVSSSSYDAAYSAITDDLPPASREFWVIDTYIGLDDYNSLQLYMIVDITLDDGCVQREIIYEPIV